MIVAPDVAVKADHADTEDALHVARSILTVLVANCIATTGWPTSPAQRLRLTS